MTVRFVYVCGHCEVRPSTIRPDGRTTGACQPCSRAHKALAEYWRDRGTPIRSRRRLRALLQSIRLVAA